MTRQSPSTEFVSLAVALAHVARERAPALAKRLLVRALADGLSARGYVIYSWPPYSEGHEQLSPELFTTYPPQHGPARIDWAEGSAVMGDGHPAPACTVYGIEVSKAELLARWPGTLKPAKPRRRSIRELVKQAEASGHPVVSVTTLDGMTIHFGQPEPGEANNPWLEDLKEAKQ